MHWSGCRVVHDSIDMYDTYTQKRFFIRRVLRRTHHSGFSVSNAVDGESIRCARETVGRTDGKMNNLNVRRAFGTVAKRNIRTIHTTYRRLLLLCGTANRSRFSRRRPFHTISRRRWRWRRQMNHCGRVSCAVGDDNSEKQSSRRHWPMLPAGGERVTARVVR